MRTIVAAVVWVAFLVGPAASASPPYRGAGEVSATRLELLVLDPARAADTRDALAAAGLRVLRDLPGGKVLVAGGGAKVMVQEGILESSPWPAEQAIAPVLRELTPGAAGGFPAGVPVVVGLAPGVDAAEVAGRLAAAGAKVSWSDAGRDVPELGLRVPAAALGGVRAELEAIPNLVFADLQPPVRLRNSRSAWRCQSGVSGSTPVFDLGLAGEGQVIGVMDTGIDVDHCHFDDPEHGLPALNDRHGVAVSAGHRKVLAVDFWWSADWPDPGPFDWDSQGHGSHVAGSAAGDQGGNRRHDHEDGMAPAAKLVIQDGGFGIDDCGDLPGLGCPMTSLEPMLAQAWAQGARIHSNSWGDEENLRPFNRYTERTADVDRFTWEHPEMLVLFAAGNGGGWGTDTVGSPATGKNSIAVGAAWDAGVEPPCVVDFSSRGWTADGRVKPDLVVPGHNVRSAANDGVVGTASCNMRASSGTSMACPTAAGLAALVRQYYTDGWYPTGVADDHSSLVPSAALLKATLIGAAVDLTTLGCSRVEPIPSRDQGWGLVQLDRALYFAGDDHHLVVHDERAGFRRPDDAPFEMTLEVAVPGPLKAVLVWTDPPSSSAAEVNLVNDLDLVVSGPDGSFRGNALAQGRSVSDGEPDRVNNVEVVWLPEAAPGPWRLTVSPHAIARGGQGWALVVTGAARPVAPRRGATRLAP